MPISFTVLGSSSSGNATLLSCETPAGPRHLLVDAGLGPRTLARRLEVAGIAPPRLDAIVITHADSDHLRGTWRRTLERDRIHVHVPAAHREEAAREAVPRDLLRAFATPFEPVPGVRFEPFVVPHDRTGSSAFRISCGGASLGWATDLGRVPPGLLEHFAGIDAIAIESNYDPQMQARSERPDFLKRRITGGSGHLSNRECLEAVRRLAGDRDDRDGLQHVVLLHLSRDCNCPRLVERLWSEQAPMLLDRLRIAHFERPLRRLDVGVRAVTPVPVQGTLFG